MTENIQKGVQTTLRIRVSVHCGGSDWFNTRLIWQAGISSTGPGVKGVVLLDRDYFSNSGPSFIYHLGWSVGNVDLRLVSIAVGLGLDKHESDGYIGMWLRMSLRISSV